MNRPSQPVERVSTLELFFDLVFVFTITQLTTLLFHEPTRRGLLQAAIMLGLIWWMYGGYAWLTNAVAPDRASRRLLLLAGMAGYLVLALAIPHAFAGSGLAFALAYAAVVAVHAGLFTRTSSQSVMRAVFGIAPFNAASATLVLVGGVTGGTLAYVLWGLAVALEWLTPQLIDDTGFEVGASHFVERHGLVVLIAVGASVVAIGIGALGRPVAFPLVVVTVLGLLLSACLWWTYFGEDDARAERALSVAPRERRPALAVNAFGYWHLPILFGIIAIAAALRRATAEGYAPIDGSYAWMLAGGVAIFMLGDFMFRRSLGFGRGRWRAGAALLTPVTVPLGTHVAAIAQIGALVMLLGAALAAEASSDRTTAKRSPVAAGLPASSSGRN